MPEAASTPAAAPTIREVPLEKGWPLLGVVPSLVRNPLAYLTGVARRRPGEIVAVRVGPIRLHVISDPEHVQFVLADEWRRFSKGGMWEATRPLIGNGLVAAEGDFWLRQRRLMQPLFGPRFLSSLVPQMVAAIARELDRLPAQAGAGEPVDVGDLMACITQRVLLETMFGASLDPAEAEGLVGHLLTAFRAMNIRLFLYFAVDKIPLPGGRAFRRSILAMDEVLMRLVKERRASGAAQSDLLSLLLGARDEEAAEGMDDRQLRDELVTLFVAGNDTTANALTWLCHALDENPEVDRRMRAEVAAVLGSRLPTEEDLPRLSYTKLVLQETMRLYPPVWMFPRFAQDEIVVGGYRIAPGSAIILCPLVTHRDPRFWERPEAFDPERFMPEAGAGRPRYAYYPFGGGPRQCIGNTFAMMEGTLIAAMLAQRYRPRRVPGRKVELASASTLKPKHGLKMTFESNAL
jgi:cytochrome P450